MTRDCTVRLLESSESTTVAADERRRRSTDPYRDAVKQPVESDLEDLVVRLVRARERHPSRLEELGAVNFAQ
jgi:hypothetical protein